MSILGAFSVSTLAMKGQATALHQIGTNVSNVQTGGYKRTDIHFQSVLGNQMFHEQDQGGIRPMAHQRIDSQGIVTPSSSTLDLAISGDGFFVVSKDFEGTDIAYTRDGSFNQKTVNDITVTDPISGEIFNTKDGYLVDKNGYFVLGYAARPDGTFPTTGTPAPMRIDKNAFSASGLPTTAASLGLNLDSNAALVASHTTAVNNFDNGGTKAPGMEILTVDVVDNNGNRQTARLNFTKGDVNGWDVSATYQGAGTAQVDTVTIGGTVDVGDVYSVTVDDTTVSYTATATDTLATVVAGLVTAINADSTVGATVTAAAGGAAGTITMTADTAGTAFTSSGTSTYGTGIAQADTISIAGALEAGDVYTVIVGGSSASYTVTGGEGGIGGVRAGIIAAINATSPISTSVLATAGALPGDLIVTSNSPGTAISTIVQAIDTSSTAQVDTATIGSLSSTYEVGDIYSATVNGTTVAYTVDGTEGGLVGIRTALRDAINNDATLTNIVTATNGGPAGDLIITAQVPGTAFTATVAATNGGATNDNTATIANTTPNAIGATPNTASVTTTTANLTPTNDNTVSTATTTANDQGLVTSSVTRIPFLGDGRAGTPHGTIVGGVVAPNDITYSFSYPATADTPAGTAAFTLDVSSFTQLANRFQLNNYNHDGRENALIQDIGFDNDGHVLGYFSNGTSQELFKIPLAKFGNPNALETENGMVFRETENSGTATIETIDVSGIAVFIPGALERSNVNLLDEFTAIIKTQQAYNSSATAFTTVNEMLETAVQTKR